MIILFVYIILMKLTSNQIITIILAFAIIIYSSFYKSKKEQFIDSGLERYMKNTGGIICDESLDNTNDDNTICSSLAKKKDLKKIWHYFYDKPKSLSSISAIWKKNYNHGRSEGLKMLPYTDFPGNDISYHRVWKEECRRIGENTPGAAGIVTGNRDPHCWIKSKMVNQKNNRDRYAWMKGNGHQFTISFWFRINKVNSGWRQILRVGTKEATTRCPGIWIYPNGTAIHTRVSTDSNWNEGVDTRHGDISMNRWTHYAVTLKGKKLKIYLNGHLLKDSTLNGNPNFPQNMTIWGGNSSNKVNSWKYRNNDIDLAEVKIFKLAVSDHFIKDELSINNFKNNVPFRLVGENNKGRLEYKFNNKWGSVCDDLFDKNNNAANVACRSMGFSGGKYLGNTGRNKKYKDPRAGSNQRGSRNTIHMDNVNCSGNEKDLRDCSSLQGPTRHNCNHYEDVVLECNN